jgi:uncharacterized membrane protein
MSIDEIRQNAGANVTVLGALLGLLARVASVVRHPARRQCVELHTRLVAELAERRVEAVHDREALRHLTRIALGTTGAGT